MRTYTSAQARDLLGVDAKTFLRWLHKAGIEPTVSRRDNRIKLFSQQQLEALAQEHERTIDFEALQQEAEQPSAEERIERLEERVSEQESQILRIGMEAHGAIEALQNEVDELRRTLDALSAGTKPRPTSVVPHKAERPATALPDGLVSWRAYAKERGIPETTAKRAIDAGKIAIEPGRWKVGHAVVTQALTEEGRKQFDAYFGLS